MKGSRWLLPGLSILLLTAAVATAMPPADWQGPASSGYNSNVVDLGTTFDINEMICFVTNQGSFAYDQIVGDSGLEWPKDSGRHVIFASGVWLGATVNGETRVTVGEYSQEYAAGPMNASGEAVDPDEADPRYRVLKLTPEDDATNEDYVLWQQLATELGDDGPPVDSTGAPLLIGDQTLWCVYNDAVVDKHSNDAGLSDPLGVEIRQTIFGFNRTGALGKTVFLDFEIENKGSNVLENMYISLWSDPDLGGAADDLVGADTTLSLGYCYNATNTDNTYGANVPAVGYDFFLGPVTAAGDTLGMTSFNKYINGTDPGTAGASYNYMQGLDDGGAPQTCDGIETKYVLTGDPVAGTSCVDSDPADRRFMLSTGPITMNPGDTQRVVAAIIVGGFAGQGDRLSNISLLKFFDLSAQDAFDRDFDVPAPPPRPTVQANELDGEIILSWGSESQNEYDQEGYQFEGYNIYQGASVSGPFTLVRTFDVNNGIAKIYDDIFNPSTGGLETVIVQQGTDAGVAHEIVLTDDVVWGGRLRNGRPYHYAVTAYSYGAEAVPGQMTLENSFEAVTLVPQKLVSGVDLGSAAVTALTYDAVDPAIPPPTNEVSARVVEAARVTGHDYRLSFHAVTPYTTLIDNVEYTVDHTWRVTDETTSTVVLDNQFNLTGNADFDVFDGLQIDMSGVYAPQVQSAAYQNNNDANRRALSWVDWGGRFFRGAVDTGCNWAGSLIMPEDEGCAAADVVPDRFGTVQFRFDGTQKGYHYHRDDMPNPDGTTGGAPAAGRGYGYAGFHDVSCTVWKVVGDVETQLTVMYIERRAVDNDSNPIEVLPSNDNNWMPTASGDGDREYLTILDLPYSDVETTWGAGAVDPISGHAIDLMQDGIYFSGDDPVVGVPALYGAWLKLRAASDVIDPEDTFTITWGNPSDENDQWTFATTAATGTSAGEIAPDLDLAKSRKDLELVRVVPNPYMTRSVYELNQFNRIVKFINLPATCTVRIFTLAGDLVHTIEKDDANTSIAEWNLMTRFGLPVGSGVLVYHVDAPGIGGTFGKMAIFMEAERLQEF